MTTKKESRAVPDVKLSNVLAEITVERLRQWDEEGFSHSHDDKHDRGELAAAAACYAASSATDWRDPAAAPVHPGPWWPFDQQWWKPHGSRRNLIRAAALIVAEIERLDRLEPKT
jgi:hypothetical protein